MPLIFNRSASPERVVLADGVSVNLPAKSRTYIEPVRMSGDVVAKLAAGVFLSLGGDPVPVAEPVSPPAIPQRETKSDASSLHHRERVIVPAYKDETPKESVGQIVVGEESTKVAEMIEDVAPASAEGDYEVKAADPPSPQLSGVPGIEDGKKRFRRRRPL